MGYDAKLDRTIWSEEIDISNPMGQAATKFKFIVSVMSYNGGQPKVDIKRLAYGAGKAGEYMKLGRLAKHELDELIPIIQEALNHM